MPPPIAGFAERYFFLPLLPASATSALKSAPARNFGTEVAGTLMVAPVAGFRAVLAGRSLFSNTPNPVMATLSPLATADWMVSSTAFTASVADFLSPIRSEIASIRSRLFILHSWRFPHGRPRSRARGSRPLTCPKVSDPAPLHNNHGHIRRRVGEDHPPAYTHSAHISISRHCPHPAQAAAPGGGTRRWRGDRRGGGTRRR